MYDNIDSQGAAVIPQIPLFELLKKYDGRTWTDKIIGSSSVSGGGGVVNSDGTGNSNDIPAVTSDRSGPVRKQYIIRKLPNYLVFHLKRFSQDGFGFAEEKNSTIVTFPVKNLEMKDYYQPLSPPDSVNESSGSTIVTKYDLIANICHDTLTAQSITQSLTTNNSTQSSSSVSTVNAITGAASSNSLTLSTTSSALSNGSYRIHVVTKVSLS